MIGAAIRRSVASFGACLAFGAIAASPGQPFADDALWNARPTGVTLGTVEVPRSKYFPAIASGGYSLGVAVAGPDDPPMVIHPLEGKAGIWDPDAEVMRETIAIPHWPAGVTPASGSDGHADIVDPTTNRIHSFFFLRNVGGEWRSAQYAWTALDGRGWGDPGHYFQGSRATGVPAMAGLIRRNEVADGQPSYPHALAMSLTFNALSPNPTYVFPATSADGGAEKTNLGSIPEGALMMLPATLDESAIHQPLLAKVVRTLKRYGAYVVDRNDGTPFVIYVENGADFDLHKGGWSNAVAAELDLVRGALRQVVGASGWVDAKGRAFTPQRALNLLSLRGPWQAVGAGPAGRFETWEQAIVFPSADAPIVQTNASGRTMQPVPWAMPVAGKPYRLHVIASGGASLKLDLVDATTGATLLSSGALGNDQQKVMPWPAAAVRPVVTVTSGPKGGGKVSATLIERGAP